MGGGEGLTKMEVSESKTDLHLPISQAMEGWQGTLPSLAEKNLVSLGLVEMPALC